MERWNSEFLSGHGNLWSWFIRRRGQLRLLRVGLVYISQVVRFGDLFIFNLVLAKLLILLGSQVNYSVKREKKHCIFVGFGGWFLLSERLKYGFLKHLVWLYFELIPIPVALILRVDCWFMVVHIILSYVDDVRVLELLINKSFFFGPQPVLNFFSKVQVLMVESRFLLLWELSWVVSSRSYILAVLS
jgi:hypothetical protein